MTSAGVQRLATVVGGQGFIGQHLVRYLRARGWMCWVPGREVSWPALDRPLGCVFYCAGLTADYSVRPFDTVEAHVSLLARVLQSNLYDSLVYLSSTRLYDGIADGVVADEVAEIPLRPHELRHLYDLTKLTGEAICHAASGGRARIARLSCVYDPNQVHDGFLPTLLQRVVATKPGDFVEIDSCAQLARDYVHVDDVVRALEWLALSPSRAVYNIAMGRNVTNEELAACLQLHTGRRIVFGRTGSGVTTPVISVASIQNDFGWKPRLVDDAVADWAQVAGGWQ